MIRKEETIDENEAPHFDDKWLQQASELPRLGLNRAPIVGHEHWETSLRRLGAQPPSRPSIGFQI
jgi:hypothetical protein